MWVLIYVLGEYVALKLGYYDHTNGWSLAYSTLLDCLLFESGSEIKKRAEEN